MYFSIMMGIHIALILIWIFLWLSQPVKSPIHIITLKSELIEHGDVANIYTMEEYWDYMIKRNNINDLHIKYYFGISNPYDELNELFRKKYFRDYEKQNLINLIDNFMLNPRTKTIKKL